MKKYLKWFLPLTSLWVLFGLTPASGNSYQYIYEPGEYAEVMDQDIAYIYFGRDTSVDCRAFEPLLEDGHRRNGCHRLPLRHGRT